MGKTYRKDKTVSKQRERLNKGRKKVKFHFTEFDYDSNVDEQRWDRKEQEDAEEIRPTKALHKQRPPESPDKKGD